MNRKGNNDNLFTPTAYWDMKLGIKHITEKVRYKKLCGCNLSKYDKEDLDGAYYITFSDWKKYMEGKLSVLNKDELFEYSKYINGNMERENTADGLFSNLMLPLSVSISSTVLIDIISDSVMRYMEMSLANPIYELILLLAKYVICIVFIFLIIKVVVNNAKENKANYLFYKDLYELVISKLQ